MRPDQLQRLQDLSEKLADSFILEADPTEWSGNGKLPAALTQQERGDRYWCKKNAMATGGVLQYTLNVIKTHTEHEGAPKDPDELDGQIRAAEKRAAEAVKRVMKKAQAHGGA